MAELSLTVGGFLMYKPCSVNIKVDYCIEEVKKLLIVTV
jgi:hypothetical protein